MSNFDSEKATLSSDIKEGKVTYNESTETTHYSIVDQYGNAIAATTTLNDGYGSKYYCDELGFFLNNEMVLLVIIGFAQNPILNIKPSVKNKKHMPNRNP